MAKLVVVLCALFFSFSNFANESLSCQDFLKGPLSLQLKKVLELQWEASKPYLDPRFIKSLEPAFKEFSEELGQEDLLVRGNRSGALNRLFSQAFLSAQKLTEIGKTLGDLDEGDKRQFQKVYQASWSALVKHLDVYSHGELKKLDLPRLMSILKEIEDFKTESREYSFFRIKRSIEGRYSINEFMLCK